MNFRTFLLSILYLVLSITWANSQQCPPGGAAFINEFKGIGIDEYVELVVIGDPAAPTAPVNLEGWIVDDNNIAQSGQGTASGHLILGSCFSSMDPGTIIVIYNPDAVHPGITPGLPNGDGAYVLPHSDPCITICSSNPNVGDDSYLPCSNASYQTWPFCVGLRNDGDGVQVRNPSADFYHGLYYTTNFGPAAETGCLDVGTSSSSLDCGDWYDVANYSELPETPGLHNTALNEALINAIANGTLDCDDINASCLPFVCPTIADIEDLEDTCPDQPFDVTATGLADMGQTENTETDFGIDFVLFSGATPPADPYTGGSSLGTVPYGGLTGISPNQTATINTSIPASGTYQICAILDPASAEPTCRPFACETIEIYENPVASLSGLHQFCPGDCHRINVLISGGAEPYEAFFRLTIGPINFPFSIPAYDINNQLNLCFDATGILPDYDLATNTLHIPTFVTGSGTIMLDNIVDGNGCSPDDISPNFTTLEFLDQPIISPAGPLEGCDENLDGQANFDLTSINSILNGGSGATILWFSDVNGTTAINTPESFYSGPVTVYAQIDDADCPSVLMPVELIVTQIAYPGIDTEVDICNIDNTILDLLDEIGGDPGGIWSDDSGAGVNLFDPGNVDFSGIIPGSYDFSYTFLATDVCPQNAAILTVVVDEPRNPGNDNGIGICFGSGVPVNLFDALGPDYEFNGDWADVDGSGVNLTDPSQVDFSAVGIGTWDFIYTLTTFNACPDQFATITVTIYEEPNAGTDATVEVCNTGTTSVDLEEALGPHDNIGFWSDDDGAGVDLQLAWEVDFMGIDTGFYNFTYTIPETDNCPEVSAIITVHVLTRLDAGEDGTIQVCTGQLDTVNLFDLIVDEDETTGIWSQISGDPADLSNPLEVILSNNNVGMDTFLYELFNDCGIDSSFAIIEVLPGQQAGSDYVLDVCQFTDTIDLFENLGVFDPGGVWINENMDTLQNPDEVIFTSPDTLNFEYILEGNGECGSDTAMATIQIIPATFAGRDSSLFFCEGSDTLLNLFDLIPELSDSTGTWIQLTGQPIDLLNADSIEVADLTIGTDSLIYVLSGFCNSDTASLVITIDNAPSAGNDYVRTVCLTETTINLFDSLTNFTLGGTWYNEVFTPIADPQNVPVLVPGVHELYYVIPAEGSCAADTAEATIIVEINPQAGVDSTIVVCEGSSVSINLFEGLGGTPDINGQWFDLDGTGFNMVNWDDLDFSSLVIGNYDFEYIVGQSGSACEPDSSTVTVNIIAAPNAGTSNDFSVCRTNNLIINLDSLLLDHDPGGDWSDLDGTGVNLNNPNAVNFSSVPSGAYAFSYFLPAGNGCPPALATITVEILDTPDAGPDWLISYCEGYMETIDLFSGLNPSVTQTGIWNDASNSGLNIDQPLQVDISNLDGGNYMLEYLLTLDPQCGTDTSVFTLSIENAPEPGSCDTIFVCNGPSQDLVDFPDILTGEDMGGEFRELTSSGVDISDPTSISFEGVIEGRYIFEYFFTGDVNCPEISTRIYVRVLQSDESYLEASICPDESFTVGTTEYNLDNPSGTEYLVNTDGCDSIVYISLMPRQISLEAIHTDANCFDEGEIQITSVFDTDLPVWLSNDDLGLVQIDELPLVLEEIPSGSYDLNLTNEVSCSFDTLISVEPFEGFLFEMPDNVTIQSGQSTLLEVNTDMVPVSIEWFPATDLSCTDCLDPIASPESDTEYTVTLIDADGCMLTGSVMVTVEFVNEVFLPNVFSPNNDAHNAYFYAQSTYSVGTYTLSIFNRWGEQVFYRQNLPFNDAESGWDGRYKGKVLMPGVYVYMIEYDNGTDGLQRISGDILLLR